MFMLALGGRLEGILCNEGRDLIDDLTAHVSKPESHISINGNQLRRILG